MPGLNSSSPADPASGLHPTYPPTHAPQLPAPPHIHTHSLTHLYLEGTEGLAAGVGLGEAGTGERAPGWGVPEDLACTSGWREGEGGERSSTSPALPNDPHPTPH